LRQNYTLAENPGMGKQGLFYYYHTMAKALNIIDKDKIELSNGEKIDWKKELTLQLFNLQNGEGYWMNENGRWWEKDPVLVTSYVLIALEILYQSM
jgi:squalene-hopene/tetraprenyl-beta-curcumene cyclase